MKTFGTLDELWLDALHLVLSGEQQASRDGDTAEVLGYVARLEDPTANFIFNPARKMSPSYAAAELIWYLSGKDSIEMIRQYAPQYERFSDDGETVWGAYGKRWYEDVMMKREGTGSKSQFSYLVELFRQKPDSRQGVIVMWNGGDLVHAVKGDKKDLPCTLCLNFILRNGSLNLVATMRSNDLWLGTPYDVWAFTCIQQLVAEWLGVTIGWYQHQATSLHIYDRNRQKAESALGQEFSTGDLEYSSTLCGVSEGVGVAVTHEEFSRLTTKAISQHACEQLGKGSLLFQCLVMALSRWNPSDRTIGMISNKLMAQHMELFR